MSKSHFLIEKAHRQIYPSSVEYPEGCTFNRNKGYWIIDSTNEPLMLSKNPNLPASKKWDRETGEDQKGE